MTSCKQTARVPVQSLSQTVPKLLSKSDSTVYNALVLIRTKFIKEKDGLRRLRAFGGVKNLLDVAHGYQQKCNDLSLSLRSETEAELGKHNESDAALISDVKEEDEKKNIVQEQPSSQENHGTLQKWQKILDVTLSILGNCCLDEKIREEVKILDGILKLANVLQNTDVDSIQNRCVRTLANLAVNSDLCAAIHSLGKEKEQVKNYKDEKEVGNDEDEEPEVISIIVKLLANEENADAKQTYLRAIRLLSNTSEHKQNLLKFDALKTSAECLKSEDESLLPSVFKTVMTLTDGFSQEVIRQLLSADTPASLMNLVQHEESSIANQSVSLLLKLTNHDDARPAVGNAGAVPYFIKQARESKPQKQSFTFTNALCLCCREAVNRVRVRENEGLYLMMTYLNQDSYACIHDRIISALVCFLYDDPSVEILIDLGIIVSLLRHLKRNTKKLVEKQKKSSDEKCKTLQGKNKSSLADDSSPQATESFHSREIQIIKVNESKVKEISENDVKNVKFESDAKTNESKETRGNILSVKKDLESKFVEQCSEKRETVSVACSADGASKVIVNQINETSALEKEETMKSCSAASVDGTAGQVKVKASKTLHDTPTLQSVSDDSTTLTEASVVVEAKQGTSSAQIRGTDGTSNLQISTKDTTLSEPCSSSSSNSRDSADVKNQRDAGVKKTVYSIHSPTYQATCDQFSFEEYFKGSKCKETFSPQSSLQSSPSCRSPVRAYSPMSTSSYGSPEWSPDFSRFSPISLSSEFEQGSNMSMVSSPGQWSPSSQGSPYAMNYQDVWSPMKPDFGEAWWCPNENDPHYSSEEEADEQQLPNKYESENEDTRLLPYVFDENPDDFESSLFDDLCNKECDKPSSVTSTSKMVKPKDSKSTAHVSSNPLVLNKRLMKQKSIVVRKRDISKIKDPLNDMLNASKSISLSTNELIEKENTRLSDPCQLTASNIFVLLSRFSHMSEMPMSLLTFDCFDVLLDYLVQVQEPSTRCVRLVNRMCRNPHCFEQLILEKIPSLIHEKMLRDNDAKSTSQSKGNRQSSAAGCSRQEQEEATVKEEDKSGFVWMENMSQEKKEELCEEGNTLLTNMYVQAESRFGKGVISHLIQSKKEQVKRCCVLSLPFICRSRAMRKKLYCDAKCLQYLLSNIIMDAPIQDEPLWRYAIQAVSYLARSVGVTAQPSEDVDEKNHNDSANISECRDPPLKRMKISSNQSVDTSHVTFILEDGRRVTGSRKVLSQSSPVFAAMLDGSFSESNMAEIKIPNVSSEAFHVSVKFIEGDTNLTSLPLDICLHMLSISDQYMLSHMQAVLTKFILDNHLTKNTVAQVFQHAVTNNCTKLRTGCIEWVLVGEAHSAYRRKCFKSLMDSPLATAVVEEIHRVICDKL